MAKLFDDLTKDLPIAQSTSPPNIEILKALHAVMTDVQYIQKDKYNPSGKYNYASERAIKEAIQPAFVKHGILFNLSAEPPVVHTAEHLDRSTGSVYSTSYVSVRMFYRFLHVETGQSIGGHFVGTGNSREDKGVYAAITGAIKYILSSTFLFATGDDPESDEGHYPATEGTTHQAVPPEPTRHPGANQSRISLDDVKRAVPTSPATSERPPMQKCPACGAQAVIKGAEQYGGGWVCWKKGGGCGSKWTDQGWASHQVLADGPFKVPSEINRRNLEAAFWAQAGRVKIMKGNRMIEGINSTVAVLSGVKQYEAAEFAGIPIYDDTPPYVVMSQISDEQLVVFTEGLKSIGAPVAPEQGEIPLPSDEDMR